MGFRTILRALTGAGLLALCGCGGGGAAAPEGLTFAATRLAFGAQQTSLTVRLTPAATAPAWTLTPSEPWLAVEPAAGTGPATVTVTVSRVGLAPGEYVATLEARSGAGQPLLPVTLTVPPGLTPELAVSPAELDFGTSATSLTFTVSNLAGNGSNLAWSAAELVSWANLDQRSGVGEATVRVTVDRSRLAPGVYTGAIRVTSSGGQATIGLRLVVGAAEPVAPPAVTVSPAALALTGGGQAELNLTLNDAERGWTATATAPWLIVAPATGSGSARLTVTVLPAGLAAGLHRAAVVLDLAEGTRQPAETLVVPVDLFMPGDGQAPQLAVAPAGLVFAPDQTSRELSVTNLGGSALEWSVAGSAEWLIVTPAAGIDAATLTVTVDRTHPDARGGRGTVLFTSTGGTAAVPVTLAADPGATPGLQVSPALLDFADTLTELPLTLANSAGGRFEWAITPSAGWVTVNPPTGGGPATVTVTINRGALASGFNLASLVVTSNVGERTVTVSAVNQAGVTPQLFVQPTGLDFGASQTERTFSIFNAGGGNLSWTVASNRPWLQVAPAAGTQGGVVTVTVDRSGLAAGSHGGTVSVTSNGGNATVAIALTVE